jgi:hypothetical protein
MSAAGTQQDTLRYRWHWLWRHLERQREWGNVEAEATVAAELVNTASLIRARIRNRRKRQRIVIG